MRKGGAYPIIFNIVLYELLVSPLKKISEYLLIRLFMLLSGGSLMGGIERKLYRVVSSITRSPV